jgi:glycosyltransferase involved in cell wall biosynthesis
MLSVLHISAWDNVGGSGRSAYRIHEGLRRLGVRSRMLVGWRSMDDDPDVGLVGAHRLWALDRLCGALADRLSLQDLCYPSSWALPRRRWVREADVIQLYNTHGGYFSHTALPALSRARPVVWRLSDMWPLTGHCVYSYDCDRWRTGCGACPILSDYPALRRDRTALLWRVKQRVYRRSRLTLVAPSRWMAGLIQESPLLGGFPLHVIPNGLDLELFRPIPKPAARQALGLNPEAPFILFGAHFASEARKGGALLTDALERFAAVAGGARAELLVIGREASKWTAPSVMRAHRLGPVRDDRTLAAVYSAADVFVLPTLADNSPNGVLESLACGTPVVSFGVGGVPEFIRHLETGYLARPRDRDDLAEGIRWGLEAGGRRPGLRASCRAVVEQEHSQELQARRFLDVYREAVGA